jgi:hypothetical protein
MEGSLDRDAPHSSGYMVTYLWVSQERLSIAIGIIWYQHSQHGGAICVQDKSLSFAKYPTSSASPVRQGWFVGLLIFLEHGYDLGQGISLDRRYSGSHT